MEATPTGRAAAVERDPVPGPDGRAVAGPRVGIAAGPASA
jgi:hypothetical protein